ncbi:M15 family metallopeptidase [Mycobacterium sp. 94-17]|uniref:M15 family metallopeptidase n=1 Tax=Mycobacterium sp. 94-17 TaxID=2986147 RepID=UPI002D1F6995|nr:M15 family metallopeptidase [Mycobacterium sp. 94-17]MEB4210048.1 M15 family metallopeptidase [Mycobacterium sp. 94-17]
MEQSGADPSPVTSARLRIAAVAATAAVTLTQCTAAPPPPVAGPSSTPAPAGGAVRPVTAAELGASWQPGCPVDPSRLRRVGVDHIGFDGRTHRGELIVHQDLVPDVVAIFAQLYRRGFPIEKIRTADHYPGADDELSMEDDNTSAFNCRRIPGSGHWSRHAYGRAVDLNPRRNPCVYADGTFEPHNAAQYVDRGRSDPGVLHDDDPVVRVFTDRGWRWGGHWRAPVDYQHFERP